MNVKTIRRRFYISRREEEQARQMIAAARASARPGSRVNGILWMPPTLLRPWRKGFSW